VFHPTEEVMESPSSNLDRPLLGAQTFRDAQSVRHSHLIMQIPIRTFVEIGSAYCFRQSNESPYYDGVTNPNRFGSLAMYDGKSEDGDDDEGAVAFPVDEHNAVLVSN